MAAPTELWHVSRTLRAMELLAIQPHSAPELAAGLGVHVRTARRLLRRLDYDGYVEPTGDRWRRYRPTMRIVALAGQCVERAELPRTAIPHITRLRDQVHEDCHLCVPSYLFALCLVHALREPPTGCRPQLGERSVASEPLRRRFAILQRFAVDRGR
jgi:DNA-binding IclR family transcriptional regulator